VSEYSDIDKLLENLRKLVINLYPEIVVATDIVFADLLARPRELELPSERIIGSPHLFGFTSVI